VSDSNPEGSLNNSDLKMAALLLQWLVLKHIAVTRHRSALARCDNTPACSWATRMSPKSKIGTRLMRALALWQRLQHASPMVTLHVAGKSNDIADIPSRSFRPEHRWNCPTNDHFLSRFSSRFPLLQGKRCQIFLISPQITTGVILELLIAPGEMDGWLKLPVIGRVFGGIGAPTNPPRSTNTLRGESLTPSSSMSPALLDGSRQELSAEDIESLVRKSRLLSGPSARPASWTGEQTLCTELQRNI